jgi:hypothetical protein|tara:strand:+ start:224 stop:436 length:213 start_codon:yes stop_codon:yes gene_type:complete
MFYAYEIATDTDYHMGVDRSEEARDNRMYSIMRIIGLDWSTHAIGTVEADNVDDAIKAIRLGKWTYSQLV